MQALGPALAACLLWSCASDPLQSARAHLRQGNHAAALTQMQQALHKRGESRQLRYALFMLQRYLALQGDPQRSEAYLQGALEQYRWIIQADGLKADFRDMESSLKASEKSRRAYEAAYALIYSAESLP